MRRNDMRPTEILKSEHRVIELVLVCLDAMAERCRKDGRLDGDSARQAIDFFRSFADRCHHAKEENQLFPLMETRGFSPTAGPTAVMRAEHGEGRSLIAGMEQALAGAARGEVAGRERWLEAAGGYSKMLRDHIEKEDHCLFPMAEQSLLPSDMDELVRSFEAVERHDIGPGVHERYIRLAEELAGRFGVSKCGVPAAARHCGCQGHA
jgi:hemerythrin-like domain-containing protein